MEKGESSRSNKEGVIEAPALIWVIEFDCEKRLDEQVNELVKRYFTSDEGSRPIVIRQKNCLDTRGLEFFEKLKEYKLPVEQIVRVQENYFNAKFVRVVR